MSEISQIGGSWQVYMIGLLHHYMCNFGRGEFTQKKRMLSHFSRFSGVVLTSLLHADKPREMGCLHKLRSAKGLWKAYLTSIPLIRLCFCGCGMVIIWWDICKRGMLILIQLLMLILIAYSCWLTEPYFIINHTT